MKRLLVLRPQPGNEATAERARRMGLGALPCPLFAVEAVEWSAPSAADFDHILFTSANALRHGGKGLASLTDLEALSVGPATADAARAAGFRVAMTGERGVAALLKALPDARRLLHLAGAEHRSVSTRHAIETVIVYQSKALAAVIPSGPSVVLVHSPRAGARLAELAPDRASLSIAAISAAAATECGTGWAALEVADQPDDAALLALAARLCQD